ncbi:MAG: acetate--CoA ligase family protein [Acidobacteriota bacterium]
MRYYEIRNLRSFSGPNYYLDSPAIVFDLDIDHGGPFEALRESAVDRFPVLRSRTIETPADLFALTLLQVIRLDLDLFVSKSAVHVIDGAARIAAEYIDEGVAKEAAYLVRDWLSAVAEKKPFDFEGNMQGLQTDFDKTLYGGPTLYSLLEAAMKRSIPVHYLFEENQFQWGYGKKQLRGRSTTFHTDGIKDTEFTTYKDMVKDFLQMCGFPTPIGRNCYSLKEALAQAEQLGFPVVVKPVAGHKGQGVTTNVRSMDELRSAYQAAEQSARQEKGHNDGVIVEQQIEGTDHRLLAVNGKFLAALQRIPAYVDGNGHDTIETLIERENATSARVDNARSPLCKIKTDENLIEFLKLQRLSLRSVPKPGERIFLRRVANISAGGVSINVTSKVHPKNVKLVEDIASFFNLTALGIDVLAGDISKPWTDGDFGIIEINAAPGVFMHLTPAIGDPLDIPAAILRSHFPKDGSERIPIVTGNRLSLNFSQMLFRELRAIRPGIQFASLTEEGILFNGEFFFKNPVHAQNVKIMLRHPKLDLALFTHRRDDILDSGMLHRGADLVILEAPDKEEEVLRRDLLPGGILVELGGPEIVITRDGQALGSRPIAGGEDKDGALLDALKPALPGLVSKYD